MLLGKEIVIFVLLLICSEVAVGDHPPCKQKRKFKDSYDFVVVGAGSAGAVVANRLSEIDDVTVLLLEAGGEEDPILNEIPFEAPFLESTEKNWRYQTEEQLADVFKQNEPRKFNWPRGKVLGGSSSLNYLMYVRGNRRDYELWNELAKSNWSWQEVLPFFKKSEDYRVTPTVDSYHSKGGYLTVSNSPFTNPLTSIFLQAGMEMDMPIVDVNGETQTGVSETPMTMRDGARCSTNKAFLKSAADRSNLDVVTGAFVTKILFKKNEDGVRRAHAVQFTKSGREVKVSARKEVIVSAGAINSPQLLMLSGIGPAEHLGQFKIPVVADLPGVGENLQDHVATLGAVFVLKTPTPALDLQAGLLEWIANKTGFMAMAPILATAFVNTKYADVGQDWPDIQLVAGNIPNGIQGEHFARLFSIPQDTYGKYFEPKADEVSFVIPAILLRPKSAGTIKLRSADPSVHPVLEANYLSNLDDFNLLLEATKIAFSFGDTTAYKNTGIKLRDIPFPGCEKHEYLSEEYFRCLVTQSLSTVFHYSGTCKMSSDTDPMGVVDSKLRVRGVAGLRVADCSIMPTVPSGNTNAPAIMVGEKAADFIKKEWGLIETGHCSRTPPGGESRDHPEGDPAEKY